MKKFHIVIAALLLIAILAGCAEKVAPTPMILVSIVENGEYSVDSNGKWIERGETAAFYVSVPDGGRITDCSYEGRWRVTRDLGKYRVELYDVSYPTRAELTVTNYYRTITYDPNGGNVINDAATEITYDMLKQSRPNVSIGTDMLVRDGYTQIGWTDEEGNRVGLGSRVTIPGRAMTLSAQWVQWAPEADFEFKIVDGEITITRYLGEGGEIFCVPERIAGLTVTRIASYAVMTLQSEVIVLPKTITELEDNAFNNCAATELYFYDNLAEVSDSSFTNCNFRTLHINAIRDPYGKHFRRESLYADKVDVLINAAGKKKLVGYGGCSMWYNMIGEEFQRNFPDYTVINMGLNGTTSGWVQFEILKNYLEEGDVMLHAPEISSTQQLMTYTDMFKGDDKTWCGIEYNYDLFALVDISGMKGVFDSYKIYFDKKKDGGTYSDVYKDSKGNSDYCDSTGSMTWMRAQQAETVVDEIELLPSYLDSGLPKLAAGYEYLLGKGVTIYVSYAVIDIDAVPEEQKDNLDEMGILYRETFEAMGGKVISSIASYVYYAEDFYDTVYHLLTNKAYDNTSKWIFDLKQAMGR